MLMNLFFKLINIAVDITIVKGRAECLGVSFDCCTHVQAIQSTVLTTEQCVSDH